ncbi:MAG: hypothetical protein GY913_30925 [Proteobacteria bacterium]|nr:hypothetical protein [Pseudomonadota bacterium]
MTLLVLSAAQAATVTTSAELRAACLDATSGDVIQVDSSDGRLVASCVLDVAGVTIEPVEGLDLADIGSVELRDGADDTTLRHLTFYTADNGADSTISVDGAEGVLAQDVHFEPFSGHGVGVYSGSIRIEDCSAEGWPFEGAPIVLYPTDGDAHVEVDGCDFIGNDGGVAVISAGGYVADATVHDTRFISGEQSDSGLGGGIQVWGQGASATVTDSHFEGNRVDPYGGAIGVAEGGTAYINGSTFVDNEAPYGGDVYVENGYAEVIGSTSSGSTSRHGAFKADENSALVLSDVSIRSPRAASGDDQPSWPVVAGVMAHGHDHLELDRVMVCDGAVDNNGSGDSVTGVLVWDGPATISRSVFQGNESTGATVMGRAAEVELDHVSLVGNQDTLGIEANEGAYVALSNSLLWDVAETWGNGVIDGGYNASLSGTGGEGDLAIDDPLFEEPYDSANCAQLPYIQVDSPLVDAANPASFDEDGSRADIGAFAAGAGNNEEHVAPGSRWVTGGCGGDSPTGALVIPLLMASLLRSRRARRADPRAEPGT